MTTTKDKMRFSLKRKTAEGDKNETWGFFETLQKHVPKLIKQGMEEAEANNWEFFKMTLLIDQIEWTVSNF